MQVKRWVWHNIMTQSVARKNNMLQMIMPKDFPMESIARWFVCYVGERQAISIWSFPRVWLTRHIQAYYQNTILQFILRPNFFVPILISAHVLLSKDKSEWVYWPSDHRIIGSSIFSTNFYASLLWHCGILPFILSQCTIMFLLLECTWFAILWETFYQLTWVKTTLHLIIFIVRLLVLLVFAYTWNHEEDSWSR